MTTRSSRRLWRGAVTAFLGALLLILPGTPAAAAPPPKATLNVWIDGWGSGTVTSRPAGINCRMTSSTTSPYEDENWSQTLSGTCHASFRVGTVVTVTATPAAGSAVNYLDCGGPSGNPCRRTMTSGYNAAQVMFCPRDGLCSAG